MKRVFISIFLLCSFYTAYAQSDLIDKIEKQAIEVDSLKRVIKSISEDQNFQQQINQKNNLIDSLKSIISEKDNQISKEGETNEQKAQDEYEKGKQSVILSLIKDYQTQSFDNLIVSSTKQSVQNDLQLIGNNSEIQPIISDLRSYFEAKELLGKKFDASQINNALTILKSINRESSTLEKLKKTVGDYQMVNDALKETIGKIITLDQKESVSGMDDETQKLKLNKILSELSLFIFNYDFNSEDYPYLSNIIFEIIKRKQPNPDADISDLINNL